MEVGFLDALTMVTLGVGQTKKSLLQEGTKFCKQLYHKESLALYALFFVPECKGNVLEAMGIGDTSNTIFTPPEGSRPGMIVSEICWIAMLQYESVVL